jgi:autotransporter passenger strand-loop-strand repeat protein
VSGFGTTRGLLLEIGQGGTATGATVSSGGGMAVSGGTASATSLQGGSLAAVASGGRTFGDVLVGSGSTLPAIELVGSGGVVSGAVLSNTGALGVFGGAADGTIVGSNPVGSGGGLVVLFGVASGTTVNSGGLELMAGGLSLATHVHNGGVLSAIGGVRHAAVVSERRHGVPDLERHRPDVTVPNGGQERSSGGAASGTILSSGGLQVLSSGGTASGTRVRAAACSRSRAQSTRRGGLRAAAGAGVVGSDVGAVGFNQGSVTVFAGGSTSGRSCWAAPGTVSGAIASAATVVLGGQ